MDNSDPEWSITDILCKYSQIPESCMDDYRMVDAPEILNSTPKEKNRYNSSLKSCMDQDDYRMVDTPEILSSIPKERQKVHPGLLGMYAVLLPDFIEIYWAEEAAEKKAIDDAKTVAMEVEEMIGDEAVGVP